MKLRDLRGYLVPLVFLLLLALLGYSYRAPLLAWFRLEPTNGDASPAAGSGSSRAAGSAGSSSDRAPPPSEQPPAGSAGSHSDHAPASPRAGSSSAGAGSGSSHAGSGSARPAEAPSPGLPSDELAYWTCGMHPSVRQKDPGICPICSMDLTPVTRAEVETGEFLVDLVRRQRIGVRTIRVARRPLTRTVRAFGSLRSDEGRVHDVTFRVSGWIERLHVRTTGAPVREGEPLLDLYSPGLYAAEREFLQALRRSRSTKGGAVGELFRSAESNLRLSGLSPARIQALRRDREAREVETFLAPASGLIRRLDVAEGAHVRAGQVALRIEDLSTVWMEAQVYQRDVDLVRVGQRAHVVFPPGGPSPLETEIDYLYPSLDPRARTGRVRAVLPNPSGALRPGTEADLEIRVELGEHLAIPLEAVVFAGARRLVFQDLGAGRLRPRVVRLGLPAEGFYPVEEGLRAGDRVVTSGNFLLAAESRIRSAETYWGADDARQ